VPPPGRDGFIEARTPRRHRLRWRRFGFRTRRLAGDLDLRRPCAYAMRMGFRESPTARAGPQPKPKGGTIPATPRTDRRRARTPTQDGTPQR